MIWSEADRGQVAVLRQGAALRQFLIGGSIAGCPVVYLMTRQKPALLDVILASAVSSRTMAVDGSNCMRSGIAFGCNQCISAPQFPPASHGKMPARASSPGVTRPRMDWSKCRAIASRRRVVGQWSIRCVKADGPAALVAHGIYIPARKPHPEISSANEQAHNGKTSKIAWAGRTLDMTKLTIRPGTTTHFLIDLPLRNFSTCGSARTQFLLS